MSVLILGAGVAGATLATLLARAGQAVTLIGPPPADGPRIGESLPGYAANWLAARALPGPLSPASPHRPIPGSVTAWHGPAVAKSYMSDPWGAHFRLARTAFDRDLQDAARDAGARICPAPAEAVTLTDAGWQVTLPDGGRCFGRYLVDATGRRAWATRPWRAPAAQEAAQIAVWAVGAPGRCRDLRTITETRPEGWWYGCLLPDGRPLACLHCPPAEAAALRRDPARWRALLAAAGQMRLIAAPADFAEAPLQATDARGSNRQPFCGSGWLAIGDAALCFDPVSAHGISFALFSAEAARDAILSGQWAEYASFCQRHWRAYAARRRDLHEAG